MITRNNWQVPTFPRRRLALFLSGRLFKPTFKPTVRAFSCAILFAALLHPLAAAAEPFRPTSGEQILEWLPTPGDAQTRELRRLRADLSNSPNDLELARSLARRYITLGRAEADPRYYGYAEAALRPWINLASPPVEVRVLRAVLAQNRHDFDGALDDLAQALAVKPNHAQALLTQAFILQVQGRYQEARRSCRSLPRGLHPLVVVTCVARIESLTGRSTSAYALLNRGLESWTDADDRLRLWALTNLGEIAQRNGDLGAAEDHYRDGLNLGQRDAYLRGAYADLLLDGGRAAETRDLLAGDTRIDSLLLRLALAEAQLGNAVAEEHRAALAARFAASRQRGSAVHRREEARFNLEILGRADDALALALANWQVQREPADARLLLAAALAAGKPGQARPALDWLRETGLKDHRLDRLAERLTARLDSEKS